MDPIPIFIP